MTDPRQRTREGVSPRSARDGDSDDEPSANLQKSGTNGGGQRLRRETVRWLIPTVTAAVFALAIGLVFMMSSASAVDSISNDEIASRSAAYQGLLTSGNFRLRLVTAAELDSAIASLPDTVTTEQRIELRAQADQGKVKLGWLTLWDTHAEDGDILRFESSASFPIEAMALDAKTTITIPLPPDGIVKVTGVRDGGGGITIALESGAAKIFWPAMQPGDMLNLPVTPGF